MGDSDHGWRVGRGGEAGNSVGVEGDLDSRK